MEAGDGIIFEPRLIGTDDPDDDPFLKTFLSRVPADMRKSFTDAQLDAVKLAFGSRGWGRHAIDLRRSLPTPFGRHYIVVLAGRERRPRERWLHTTFGKLTFAVMIMGVVLVLALAGLGTAYVTKRALGIDVLPGIDTLDDAQIEQLLN